MILMNVASWLERHGRTIDASRCLQAAETLFRSLREIFAITARDIRRGYALQTPDIQPSAMTTLELPDELLRAFFAED